jgi:hypothetical protein
MSFIYSTANTIVYPREVDWTQKRWWKITLYDFTDYGSSTTRSHGGGNFYGTVAEAQAYAAKLPHADSWGTLQLDETNQKPHCKTCTCFSGLN